MKEKKYSKKLATMILTGVAGVSLLGLTGCTINIGTPANNNSNVTSTRTPEVKKTKSYSVGGYNLEIPEEYYAEYKGTSLRVSSSELNPSWISQMQIISGTNYNTLNTNQTSIKNKLASSGITVENVSTKTINGINWLTVEGVYIGYKYIYAYGDDTTSSVFYLAVASKDTYDYTKFNELANIYSNAKTSKNNSSAGFSIENIPGLDSTELTDVGSQITSN